MADIKILKANGVDVHPVTHEDAVVNNLGLSVGFTLQAKSDTYLSTTAKTIVGGINEINAKKVLREADQGTVTGTNTSVKIISLKCGGARFYPVCHSDYVLHTDGKSLQSNINTLKTNNTNVTNRVSTLESTLKAIQTNNTSSNTTINTVSTNIGKLSDLQTSAKGNLVAAVNEINQFGSNLKNRLRTALDSKGITDSSLTYTINDLIEVVESDDTVYKKVFPSSYTVTPVDALYGFDYNPSTGYWTSTNAGKDSTAAVCKVTIDNPGAKTVRIYFINWAEEGFDYGLIGNMNTTLSSSHIADSSGVRFSCKSSNSSSEQFVTLGTGKSGWFYVKYIKDDSSHHNNDNFQFRIEFL